MRGREEEAHVGQFVPACLHMLAVPEMASRVQVDSALLDSSFLTRRSCGNRDSFSASASLMGF